MLYTDSEKAWIERRGAEISEEKGWPLPIAKSEAGAQLARARASGRTCPVVKLPRFRKKRGVP